MLVTYSKSNNTIYSVYNFSKPQVKRYKRPAWKYDQRDSDLMRDTTSTTDWNSPKMAVINEYANYITNKILTEDCVPNENVTIRPSD